MEVAREEDMLGSGAAKSQGALNSTFQTLHCAPSKEELRHQPEVGHVGLHVRGGVEHDGSRSRKACGRDERCDL